MSFRCFLSLIVFSVIIALPLQVEAETRYVSDVLVVSLRDAPSRSASIIGHLRSGNVMEVVEENEDGYVLITTDAGDQGWMQARYTTTKLPKTLAIDKLKAQLISLQKQLQIAKDQKEKVVTSEKSLLEELAQLKKSSAELINQIGTMKMAVTEAESSYVDLQEKSKGVAEVYRQRDEFLARHDEMKQKIAFLEAENNDLVQTGRILWFLAGFGVFLVGWMMGKMGRKQRHSPLSL